MVVSNQWMLEQWDLWVTGYEMFVPLRKMYVSGSS